MIPDLLAIHLTTQYDPSEKSILAKKSLDESLPGINYAWLVIPIEQAPDITVGLNMGIQAAAENGIPYITWTHSDMEYDDSEWFPTLVKELENPSMFKICASNSRDPLQPWRIGQEQTYLLKTENFLGEQERFLFDEKFIRCGGYEDWYQHFQLLASGLLVAITDKTTIHHLGAQTRSTYDSRAHQQYNHDVYCRLTGFRQAIDPHHKRVIGLYFKAEELPELYAELNEDYPQLGLSVEEHLEYRNFLNSQRA